MDLDKTACITLDLENDWYFDEPGYDHLTFQYLDDYISLISDLDIPVSVFVVGQTLERFPEAVDQLRQDLNVEFHLHSYYHDMTKSYDFVEDLQSGIQAYEKYFGCSPIGYRAPQGNLLKEELPILEQHGFTFDSSIFPSYRPGIYNNLNTPLTPYRPDRVDNLIEIPFGVVPKLRIPLSQSYLKLFGRPFLTYIDTVSLPDVVVFDSHLQDFFKTASHDRLSQPLRSIHKRNIDNSIQLFRSFVDILRETGYSFEHITTIYEATNGEL